MTTAMGGITGNSGYAHAQGQRPGAVVMVEYEDDLAAMRAELERQVRAGKWLRVGSVATLLDVSRSTAHRLLAKHEVRFKRLPGSKYRLANPDDVLRVLEESQQMEGEPIEPSNPDGQP